MSFYQQLLRETTAERNAFIAVPIVQEALTQGVDRATYVQYLTQAYHHVRYTVPLLCLAASRCTTTDRLYQTALLDYVDEEKGHDEWILDDIAALGGDAESVRHGLPRAACEVMVGHAHYLIEHVSPYGMLGMVHVLEGMSAALANAGAAGIAKRLGVSDGKGFSYLRSHGALDEGHQDFFARLVDSFADPAKEAQITRATKTFYRLYGDVFRDVAAWREENHAT
jgi:pyrroloquinoline quinone (PQQ) biosynthesis protein C